MPVIESEHFEFNGDTNEDMGVVFDLNDLFSICHRDDGLLKTTDTDIIRLTENSNYKPPVFSTPCKSLSQGASAFKSPFSLSSLCDNSPVSSPHSSTPISFDVSFTKSFDTPSFHSPISNQLNQNSLYPCQTDHVFMEMKSDTILTWDKKLETPHQQLATPERPKIDKSAVAVTKKLFVSPGSRIYQKCEESVDAIKNPSDLFHDAKSSKKCINNIISKVEKKDIVVNADISFKKLEESSADKLSIVPKQMCIHDVSSEIEHHIFPESCTNENRIETSKSSIADTKVHKMIGLCQTNVKLTNKVTKIYDEPMDSIPIFSGDFSDPTEVLNGVPNFKYPIPTQSRTQLEHCDIKDSIAFSQWPNDIYEKVDELLSEATSKQNDFVRNDQEIKSTQQLSVNCAAVISHEIAKDTDTNEFSQWPEDVFCNIDAAVTILKYNENIRNHRHIHGDSEANKTTVNGVITTEIEKQKTIGNEHASLINISRKSSITEKKTNEKDLTNRNVPRVNNALNFFSEDLSDLNVTKEFGFASASSFDNAPPMNAVPQRTSTKSDKSLSFFGEDFSDLDLVSFNCQNVGFNSASKAMNSKDLRAINSKKLIPTSTEMSDEFMSPLPLTPIQTKTTGFSTASGKPVDVSKISVEFIRSSQIPGNKNKSEQDTEDLSDLKVTKEFGFASASSFDNAPPINAVPQRTSTKSDKSLSFFGEDLSDLDLVSFNCQNVGFNSASKAMNSKDLRAINSKKLIPTSTEMSDEFMSPLPLTPIQTKTTGFSTASGKPVDVSKITVELIRSSQIPGNKNKSEQDTEDLSDLKVTKEFGFASASSFDSGPPMNAVPQRTSTKSDKSLSFFGEDLSDLDLVSLKCQNVGFNSASKAMNSKDLRAIHSKKLIPTSTEMSEEFMSPLPLTPIQTKTTGFSTASGKPVDVSEVSVEFIRSSQIPGNKIKSEQGTEVDVSKSSMNFMRSSQVSPRAGGTDANVSKHSKAPIQETHSTGFSTASGVPVTVTEESMEFIKSSQIPHETSGRLSSAADNSSKDGFIDLNKPSVSEVAYPANSSGKSYIKHPVNKNSMDPQILSRNCNKRIRDDTKKESMVSKNSSKENVKHQAGMHIEDNFPQLSLSLRKRRRISRTVQSNSPATTTALTSSPISQKIRPGMSPLLSSPKLESTLEDTPLANAGFVTPYNCTNNETGTVTTPTTSRLKKSTSVLWKRDVCDLSATKVIKPVCLSIRRPLQCLPIPRHHSSEELFELGASCAAEDITSQNAVNFKFSRPDYFIESNEKSVTLGGVTLELDENGSAGKSEFYKALHGAPNIKEQYITEQWVDNHYRLVVWKSACQERSQPDVYAGVSLTPHNVMSQLLSRYYTEAEEGLRSSLRKITEKDDSSNKPLTLLVSHVGSNTLELTDGWYCLPAIIDTPLSVLIRRKVIVVGSKVVSFSTSIQGAHTDGVPPLQARDSLQLKLNYNSVRPAAWHAKLGYTDISTLPTIPLTTLAPDGGICVCLACVVIRRYPGQYLETLENGKKVFRNERGERIREREHERERDKVIESISHAPVQNDLIKKIISKEQIKNIESGKGLFDLMKKHPDPTSLQDWLSANQLEMLSEFTKKEGSKLQMQSKEKILEELKEKCPPRKVTSLVKYKIACAHQNDGTRPNKHFYFTVWRANQREPLEEGKSYKIYNVGCSAARPLDVAGNRAPSLSSSQATVYRQQRGNYSAWTQKPVCTVSTPTICDECDLIGRVLQTDRHTDKHYSIVLGDETMARQVFVYLSDFAEPKIGSSQVLINLQVSKSGKLIFNEKTTMTAAPKSEIVQGRLNDFNKMVHDKCPKFWDDLLARYIVSNQEEELFDEIPELPPLDMEIQTPANIHPGTNIQTPNNSTKLENKKPENKVGDVVPLFSVDISLPGCSDSAKSNYQTPVKPCDYDSIFQ